MYVCFAVASFFGSNWVEKFVFGDLSHQTMDEFNWCTATVSCCFCEFIFGTFFIWITTCRKKQTNRNLLKISSTNIDENRKNIQIIYILETTNGPLPKLVSLCSNFSDKSKICPVVYSVLLNKPELPSVLTQYLFHNESNSFRSKADLK